MKIKIAHVINDLGLGGAQRIVADIVTHLNKDIFDPIIINLNFSHDNSIEKEILAKGIKVVSFPAKFKGDLRCFFFLIKFLRKNKISILHCHLFLASFYSTLAAQIAKTPFVVSTEHNTSTLATKPFYYKIAAHYYLKNNSRIFVISNAVKNVVLSKLPDLDSKVHVVYNGINLNIFKPNSLKQQTKTKFTVGTIVRNDPRKGFPVFLNCAKKSNELKLDINYVASKNSCKKSGKYVEKIEMAGDPNSVVEFLSQLDVFVLPSFEEGLGLAAIEAMAVGIPVIVSDAGGLTEVVDHKLNGLVFKAGNDAELLFSIQYIKENPGEAIKFRKAGLLKVKKYFALKNMISSLESHYLELYNSI